VPLYRIHIELFFLNGFIPDEGGVYISRWFKGSPAHKYGLRGSCWITHVNDIATDCLDNFLEVTKDLEDGQFVRLRLVSLQKNVNVLTIKTDFQYWELECYIEMRWESGILKGMEECVFDQLIYLKKC